MDIRTMSDAELHADLIDAIQLEGEAKRRAEPLRKELLRRQVETGEATIERDGWNYSLKREPISAAWIEREYGYADKEIPGKCFTDVVKLALAPHLVKAWLEENGHDMRTTYSLTVARKKI